jgi:oligoendopeptidase F
MLQAQKDTYGDGLASYHPYMWAAKPHYYSQGSFYNFPYMFGLLFSLGLYKKFDEDPDSFRARYDDLLSSTGMADAAELGQRFGFDTRDIGFWRGSFDVLRRDIDEFVSLV